MIYFGLFWQVYFVNSTHLWNNSKIIRSGFSKSEGENMLVKSVNFLPSSIKSMNPMPK